MLYYMEVSSRKTAKYRPLGCQITAGVECDNEFDALLHCGAQHKTGEYWATQRQQNTAREEFDSEEVARYICEKIAIEEADFLSDKTKDKFRSLYRLIAERIRQQQNLMANQSSDKKKMSV